MSDGDDAGPGTVPPSGGRPPLADEFAPNSSELTTRDADSALAQTYSVSSAGSGGIYEPSSLHGLLDSKSGDADVVADGLPALPSALVAPAPALSAMGVSPALPDAFTYSSWFNPAPGAHGLDVVLVDGDGNLVHGPAAGAGAGGSAGGSGASPSIGGGTTNSPLHINITYDSSVANAPAAFKAAVVSVVQFFESQFSDPVTVNIHVGYGEVGGYRLDSNALGESLTYLTSYSYSQVKNALAADATSAADSSTIASLPASSPVSGTMWTSTAEAKALGLLSSYNGVDGYVGFASGNWFDYDNNNGVSAGQYDFYGCCRTRALGSDGPRAFDR